MAGKGSIQFNPLFDEYSPLPLRILVGSSSKGPNSADVQTSAQHHENAQSSTAGYSRSEPGIRNPKCLKDGNPAAPRSTRVLTFFMLPGEVRNQIYREVLVDGQRVTLDRKDVFERTRLLRTCRRIRREASSIWYAENRFLVLLSADDFELFPSWLDLMGKKNQRHLTSLQKTFEIAYVFSKARVAAVDWPAKHERYLFAITHSQHAAVHAEDSEECTDDWNEIQMIWLNLACTFFEQELWEWKPVIDWDVVKAVQVKSKKMETWQHYKDSAKEIYTNELQLKIQQLRNGNEEGAKTYQSWLKVCEKYDGNGQESEA
ncbi:hypothetical protein HII31_06439 [Pseudocercospora fuligena]|uniref:Uncharacterized protein n=1 Tax=Pseudocercospora fuligena TaxID=685502 RepID=A0A8H6RK86_9PEZI|nr:hypothetical protein HII31_06439 [Pseudocercospora fuligena]